MSVSSILNIAKNALSASQMSIQTTSHNIANVDTQGYSRQEAVLEEMTPTPSSVGLMGNGVNVKKIISYYDQHLQTVIANKNTDLEEQKIYQQYLTRIEGIFNEDNSQLSKNITNFFGSWQDLSADPTSTAARQSIASNGQNVSTAIKNMYGDLKGLQTELNDNVDKEIDDINAITASIASLNELIFQGGVGTSEANDYIDQRNELLKQLSGKVDVITFYDSNNRETILTSSGKSLVDGGMSWNLVPLQDQQTGYSKVGWQDSGGNVSDITSQLAGGSLNALVSLRDNTINQYISDLDGLARGIMDNVNYFHKIGNGNTGASFFEPVTEHYAMNLHLSDQILDSSSGQVQVQNILATSSATGGTDNDIAARIASLVDETLLGGNEVKSKVFASDSAQGLSGSLLINGVSVTLQPTDTLTNIAAAINAPPVKAQTEVTASVTRVNGGYQLVLQAARTSERVSVLNGTVSTTNGTIASALGLKGSTFVQYTAGVVATVGEQARGANQLLDYNRSTMTMLESQREGVSGVSIDEEMANLVKFQHAYQAAARLYSVADELLKNLLEAV